MLEAVWLELHLTQELEFAVNLMASIAFQ